MTSLLLPYEGKVKLESRYGYRTLNGETNWHNGIDLVGLESKIIIAPCNGVIKSSTIIEDHGNKTWEWGNYVRLDNEEYSIFMCHMSERFVNAGEAVVTGQPLGVEGNTGYSFGSHCHFETRKISNGITVNPCDLLGIFNGYGILENEKPKTPYHEWSEDAINDFLKRGILKGYEDGGLRLNQNITREEAVVLIYRALKSYGNID